MKNFTILAILAIALISSCIGQEEVGEETGEKATEEVGEEKGWTIENWKEHLFFLDIREQSAAGMVTGLRNFEALPMGTHMKYKVEFGDGTEETGMPYEIVIGLTVSGKEPIDGIECTVIDFTQDMEMETFGISMTMTFEGTEWVDETGAPVKMEGTAITKSEDVEMPTEFTVERIGEELYEGHDCWLYEMTQSTEMMGQSMEVKFVQYVDKSSFAVVRALSEMMGTEQDSGYLEPEVSAGEFEWELGNRETITTELGTFDCQVIYLKVNGEVLGTIWANEEFKVPIKYVYSYKTEDTEFEMTMTLLEYA